MDEILQDLNEQQQDAVKTIEGPLLVLAGAGSGKTKVITHRIAHLVKNKNISAYNILAITFTNKAAKEMRERVNNLIGDISRGMWIMTFHAMCVQILRFNIDRLEYDKNFTILDESDKQAIIKKIMKDLNIDNKMFSHKAISGQISNYKNQYKFPKDVENLIGSIFDEKVYQVYERYQKLLRKDNCLDFDDLLMLTIKLFKKDKDVLEHYQKRFKYIHVDEYQDTNKIQFMIVKMLSALNHNLCVVGDSDQAIYSWRGADIRNILEFEDDFKNQLNLNPKIIKLERNYRSTQVILDAANNVISNNTNRQEKELWTDLKRGEKITYFRAQDSYTEASYVAEVVKRLTERKSINYNDFAVLYRTNAMSRELETIFKRNDIPYKLVGNISYFERKEIKDLLAYLRLIVNPNDDMAFTRVVNVPKRGIGPTTVEKLANIAFEKDDSIFNIINEELPLPKSTIAKVLKFKDIIINLNQKIETCNLTDFVDEILIQSEYMQMLKKENTLEATARIENLEEFKSVTSEFEQQKNKNYFTGLFVEEGTDFNELTQIKKLELLLSELSLLTSTKDESEDGVTLMTVHAAKGLEFNIVFIVGLEDRIFPLERAKDSLEEMEEERRLAYVAITRAKHKLFITTAESRMRYGSRQSNEESTFLKEINHDLIDYKGQVKSKNFKAINLKSINKEQDKVDYKTGDKVRHTVYEEGIIVSIEAGIGTIAFSHPHGIRKILLNHPTITKI